jgi:hypothetical protein
MKPSAIRALRKKHLKKMTEDVNVWKSKYDHSNIIARLGNNGVLYEYVVPLRYHSSPRWYKRATDVRSHKKAGTRYDNGKKPGQYQPVGDKSNFTFYEIQKYKNLKKAKRKVLYALEVE